MALRRLRDIFSEPSTTPVNPLLALLRTYAMLSICSWRYPCRTATRVGVDSGRRLNISDVRE